MLINGTDYDDRTPEAVASILESSRLLKHRIRIFYGDRETGRDWGEENDTMGYVGRSTGTSKIPLLIRNTRSYCGSSLLDHCIVKIMDTRTKRVLYSHPTYHRTGYRIMPLAEGLPAEYTTSIWAKFPDEEWQNTANFTDYDRAVRYVEFMTGERMSK